MADSISIRSANPTYQAPGTPRFHDGDELGGAYVSQLLPKYAALARYGAVFSAVHAAAQAVAPLQDKATTTAAFVVNNVSTSKCLVMLKAGYYNASGTSDKGQTLVGGCSGGALATQLSANGTGVVISSHRGSGSSSAFADFSKTVVAGWSVLDSMESTADAVPGAGRVVDLEGLFIIPPTFAFMLHVISGAGTTAKFAFGCTWAEVQMTIP